MIQIKSYKLINYLNRLHGPFSCFIVGILSWLGSIVASNDTAIAKWAWACFKRNDFKHGIRFCAWQASVRWPRLDMFGDHFFDFTAGADERVLAKMDHFLSRFQSRRDVHLVQSDQLYVLAAQIHCMIQQSGGVPSLVEPMIKKYELKANELLSIVSHFRNGGGNNKKEERKGDFSLTHAREVLKDFITLFPRDNWRWYVVAGTFLGAHREGNFLAHDYDIDLGFNDGELDSAAMLRMLSQHSVFKLKKIDYQIEIVKEDNGCYALKLSPAMFKIIHKNGLNIDIFIHYRKGGFLWRGSIIHRWFNTAYDLADYNLAGFDVSGPGNPELYLSESYGDWETPISHFDCSSDSSNLTVANNYLSISLFLKRLGHFAYNDSRRYSSERAFLIHSSVLFQREGVLRIKKLEADLVL